MYAVFLSGGKQYRVIKNQTVRLEKINTPIGTEIKFNKILLIKDENDITIGNPFISGGIIQAYIKKHGKSKKIKIVKFNRRKHYKKQQGHRQSFTDVKIIDINNS
ncbi:50S ribosomal protein L21 [Buchnera aphidicola]|uniref:50S ribosomal protein L21 n=1 Tax=Buchnera aphidicola TaxID=9 RepID=UPI003BEEFC04